MKKKYHIPVSLLYLIYFSIYAVSPLSYAYDPQHDADQTNIQSPKIFVIELLLSKCCKQKPQDKSSSSTNLLLKKKRAVLSSSKLKVPENTIEKICIVPDYFVFTEIPAVIVADQHTEIESHKGFHSSHSGLSPPLA